MVVVVVEGLLWAPPPAWNLSYLCQSPRSTYKGRRHLEVIQQPGSRGPWSRGGWTLQSKLSLHFSPLAFDF